MLPTEYGTPEGMRTLANWLRSDNGVKVRSGIEHEKRVEYFKGKKLIEALLEGKKWPKSLPKITDKVVARLVAGSLIQAAFFHRSEKVEDKKGYLRISKMNVFEESGYYTWMYAGSMMWSNIATIIVIALVIGFTLLPIWPDIAKKVLWYFSVTFLIFTLSFCLFRFLAFMLLWLIGYEFWIFPRLFDESLSFQDSFKPVYTFEKGSSGQGYYRILLVILLIGFGYWACTQPTEFDELLKVQKDFIDDLYSGKLLADVATDHTMHLDRSKKVPSLEDLLRELENDDAKITDKVSEDTDINNNSNNTVEELSDEALEAMDRAADAAHSDESNDVSGVTDNSFSSDGIKEVVVDADGNAIDDEAWTPPEYDE